MSNHPPHALLLYLVQYGERVGELVRGESIDSLRNDRTKRDALLWNFVVFGEVTNRLGEAFQESHKGIPWSAIIGMRNIVPTATTSLISNGYGTPRPFTCR